MGSYRFVYKGVVGDFLFIRVLEVFCVMAGRT